MWSARWSRLLVTSPGGGGNVARISQRAQSAGSSATLDINETVARMQAAGERVFDLGLGEADYVAPPPASAALAEAAKSGRSRYTDVQGCAELRRAVARSLNDGFYRRTSGSSIVSMRTTVMSSPAATSASS